MGSCAIAKDKSRLPLKHPICIDDLVKSRAVFLEVDEKASHGIESTDELETIGTKRLLQVATVSSLESYKFPPVHPHMVDMKMISLHPSGFVKKLMIRPGTAMIPEHAKVLYHYVLYLDGKTEPLDEVFRIRIKSSFLDDKCETIFGMKIGLRSMRSGEVSAFLIHPDFAYGEFGFPELIPPRATVIFVVEMIGFAPLKVLDSVGLIPKDELMQLSFQDIKTRSMNLKLQGDQFFNCRNYASAAERYEWSLNLLETFATSTESDDFERMQTISILHLNKGLCYLLLGQPERAVRESNEALRYKCCPERLLFKAYFRIAQGEFKLNAFENALSYARRALYKAPPNIRPDIQTFIAQVRLNQKNQKSNEREMYKRMLRTPTPGRQRK